MEQRVGKLNRWITALFLCLAAGLCALAGTLFVRAETMDIPVPDGPEGPGAVLEEFFSINSAMKMRDIRFGGKNADKLIEYRIVPLLICSARIGSELSAAALTRGLSTHTHRTNICKIGFRLPDAIVWLIMLTPYVLLILNKTGVVSW